MTAAISLSGVTKRFGKFTAVDRLDLEVPVGVTFGLLGPNGAGKTTTIRMTMNITKADEGTVRILGKTLDEEGQQRIGYLPEERGLYRKMTVLDQLLFFAAIKGVEKKTALARLEKWIDVMDLRPWLKKKTEELSKGMQQKVQFLGTIVHDPEVLILDEPFSEVVKVSRDLPGEGSNRRRPSRRRFTAVDRFPGLGSEALSRLPGVRAAEATGLAAACVRLHAGSAVR